MVLTRSIFARTFLPVLVLRIATICSSAQFIDIRVSVKIILDPITGARPDGVTDDVFYMAATNANKWMFAYSRGYRFRITEITEIGGPANGSFFGPSQWFGRAFKDDPDWTTFQNDAKNDLRYKLRVNQINAYISTGVVRPGNSGGNTPIPPDDLNTAVEVFPDTGAWWLCHELGHFFGLRHTFAGEDKDSCTPGDDGIDDTLVDSNCWTTLDQVSAYYFFGLQYNQLFAPQKATVDSVFYNTMSYHDAVNKNATESYKSEGQLDRETDEANTDRAAFVSGRTIFVSPGGSDSDPGNLSAVPKRTVANAVTVANAAGNDILLLRAGSYPAALTINKAVTLRATRVGVATLGK
jgi:hypothetical protein